MAHKFFFLWASEKREVKTNCVVPSECPGSKTELRLRPRLHCTRTRPPVEPGEPLRVLYEWELLGVPGKGTVRHHYWARVVDTLRHWGRHLGSRRWHWPHVWYAGSLWCSSSVLARLNLGTVLLLGSQRDRWWGDGTQTQAGPYEVYTGRSRVSGRLSSHPARWQGPCQGNSAERSCRVGLTARVSCLHTIHKRCKKTET